MINKDYFLFFIYWPEFFCGPKISVEQEVYRQL